MLIEFRVENHRSLRDEQVLTAEVGIPSDPADARPRTLSGYPKPLLPVAVLYGANASGKSNVLSAIAFMCSAVLESHRVWPPDEGIPRDPFKLGPKRSEPSLFEIKLVEDGVRYEYGFTANDECFLEEWLRAWPRGKRQNWFERDGQSFKFGEALNKAEIKLIEEVTRPNALFLSAAAQHGILPLRNLYSWFGRLSSTNVSRRSRIGAGAIHGEIVVANLLSKDEESRRNTLFESGPRGRLVEQFRNLMIEADFGIIDVRVNPLEPDDARRPRRPRIDMKHRAEDGAEAWLPLHEESQGTQTLFRLALPFLQAIDEGGVLLVDELEACCGIVAGLGRRQE